MTKMERDLVKKLTIALSKHFITNKDIAGNNNPTPAISDDMKKLIDANTQIGQDVGTDVNTIELANPLWDKFDLKGDYADQEQMFFFFNRRSNIAPTTLKVKGRPEYKLFKDGHKILDKSFLKNEKMYLVKLCSGAVGCNTDKYHWHIMSLGGDQDEAITVDDLEAKQIPKYKVYLRDADTKDLVNEPNMGLYIQRIIDKGQPEERLTEMAYTVDPKTPGYYEFDPLWTNAEHTDWYKENVIVESIDLAGVYLDKKDRSNKVPTNTNYKDWFILDLYKDSTIYVKKPPVLSWGYKLQAKINGVETDHKTKGKLLVKMGSTQTKIMMSRADDEGVTPTTQSLIKLVSLNANGQGIAGMEIHNSKETLELRTLHQDTKSLTLKWKKDENQANWDDEDVKLYFDAAVGKWYEEN